MVVMVMMMMVVVMMHRLGGCRRGPGGRTGDSRLRERISAEAERDYGSGGEGLDHGRSFFGLRGGPRAHAQP